MLTLGWNKINVPLIELDFSLMRKTFFILIVLIQVKLFAQVANNCNCCTQNHSAFDFWVGEWNVINSINGTPAGTSIIEKVEDGCAIREYWTSEQAGYTGTSLNFFNTTTGQWEQLWIDNAGAVLKLKGGRTGNRMILISDPFKGADGKTYINQITWTNNLNGTVRQLWEVLRDCQVSSVAFDGIYTKVEKTKNR